LKSSLPFGHPLRIQTELGFGRNEKHHLSQQKLLVEICQASATFSSSVIGSVLQASLLPAGRFGIENDVARETFGAVPRGLLHLDDDQDGCPRFCASLVPKNNIIINSCPHCRRRRYVQTETKKKKDNDDDISVGGGSI
jgi:hypothetical protein